jgi:hypothetical protein
MIFFGAVRSTAIPIPPADFQRGSVHIVDISSGVVVSAIAGRYNGARNEPPAVNRGENMSRVLLGVICGLVFGAIDIGIMLPMSFPDKRAAITAAFIARFGIGFAVGSARLPWPGWAVGLCFGLLLSIPDALITKAYGPIIGMGALGGTIIGVIVTRFGQ